MNYTEIKALCSMARGAGIKTLGELQALAQIMNVTTPDGLLLLAEALWDYKRGLKIYESRNKRG